MFLTSLFSEVLQQVVAHIPVTLTTPCVICTFLLDWYRDQLSVYNKLQKFNYMCWIINEDLDSYVDDISSFASKSFHDVDHGCLLVQAFVEGIFDDSISRFLKSPPPWTFTSCSLITCQKRSVYVIMTLSTRSATYYTHLLLLFSLFASPEPYLTVPYLRNQFTVDWWTITETK